MGGKNNLKLQNRIKFWFKKTDLLKSVVEEEGVHVDGGPKVRSTVAAQTLGGATQ